MLSQDTQYRLGGALTDVEVAAEVNRRVSVQTTPADAAAAQAVLDTLNTTKAMNDAIAERLFVGMAGSGAQGNELARKVNGMVAVLQAMADGDEVPAVAASFTGQVAGLTTDVTIDADEAGDAGNITLESDYAAAVAASFTGQVAGMTTDVTIDADTAGAAGNSIVLTGDGVSDIDALILAWNIANPANTASLTSGDGSQVPDLAEEIELAGGEDEEGSDIDALILAWNTANPANTVTLSDGDGSQVPQADIELTGGEDAHDGNLEPSLLAMGDEPMSDSVYESLTSMLTDVSAANDFKTAYNAMIEAIQAA